MADVEERLKKIARNWFYSEPLLFSAWCTHSLFKNDALKIPMRTGHLRVEFSEKLLTEADDTTLESLLTVEMYRILLQHPYKRQPINAQRGVLLLSSDVTIHQLYKCGAPLAGVEYLKTQAHRFKTLDVPLSARWSGTEEERFFLRNLNVNRVTGDLETIDDLSYEEWYRKILFLIKETSGAGGESVGSGTETADSQSEAAELWEENEEAQNRIQSEIKKADREQGWGSTSGAMQREILEGAEPAMDYRRILAQFRSSAVSAERTLTRMRPSRRFGFSQMGSRYERKANILVAVDVSGSISDDEITAFFSVIKNFFVYGIERLDVIFFDTALIYREPITLRKKFSLSKTGGRGGTDFQCALDFYAAHPEYSGMIIFTDGEGDAPVMHGGKTNLLWILSSRADYDAAVSWIQQLPGSRAAYLPL